MPADKAAASAPKAAPVEVAQPVKEVKEAPPKVETQVKAPESLPVKPASPAKKIEPVVEK